MLETSCFSLITIDIGLLRQLEASFQPAGLARVVVVITVIFVWLNALM